MSLLTSGTNVTPLIGARDTGAADAGDIYSVINVPGTPVAGHPAATTFDQTKAYVYLYNAGAKNVYPVRLRLQLTNAGTAATTVRFEIVLDKGADRFSSGGSTFAPINVNMASGSISGVAQVRVGAVVLATNTASSRTIGDAFFRNVIGVVSDTYQIAFGEDVTTPQSAVASNGTSVYNGTIVLPPCVVPPSGILAIHQWSTSQSGAYQFDGIQFDYIEA